MKHKKLTREEILSILELRKENKSNKEIADALGVHEMTIGRWVRQLRKAGYEIPKVPLGRKKIQL